MEVQDHTLPTKESTEQGVAADIPQPAEDEFCASSSVRHTLLLAQSQSNAMLKIVSSFEERLSWLEETMLPIDRCVRRRLPAASQSALTDFVAVPCLAG